MRCIGMVTEGGGKQAESLELIDSKDEVWVWEPSRPGHTLPCESLSVSFRQEGIVKLELWTFQNTQGIIYYIKIKRDIPKRRK